MKQPCILLLHANGLCRDTWDPCVKELAVLVPDARIEHWDLLGHGMSATGGMPIRSDRTTDWDMFGVDLIDRIRRMSHNGPIYGVGHSQGGAVLLIAEAMCPGTFESILAFEPPLIDPNVHRQETSKSNEFPLVAQALRRRERFPAGVEEVRSYLVSKAFYSSWDPNALEGYIKGGFYRDKKDNQTMVLACRPTTEAANFASAFPLRRWEWLTTGGLTCPVQLFLGQQSRFGKPGLKPSVGAYFDRAFQNHLAYHRDSIPGSHMAPLENPKQFAQVVAQFLKSKRRTHQGVAAASKL